MTTGGMIRFLIADDDKGDRKQIRRALKASRLPHSCVEAESMEQALAICSEMDFDCAILDYRLPGEDGLMGVAALRERHPFMAIIMATGQGDELVAAEAIKRGANDYIPKADVSGESLRRISETALERSRLQRKIAQQREDLELFAMVLAHDLRSPLGAIEMACRIIEMGVGKNDMDVVRKYSGILSNSSKRLNSLISTLQQYTQIDAPVTFEAIELKAVLADTIASLEDALVNRHAEVLHGDLPLVIGNAPQLSQLLQNLIGNGIKYCKADRPTIEVLASPVSDSACRISIRDNGIGIAPDRCEEIFQPFKRLHSRETYEGTGLGLATCRKIVERHGGRIWCESTPGAGSTFHFTLNMGADRAPTAA